ncbi:putative metallocarboxypeptidase ecm14 [Kalmusia sp. IMI 367209]|nr:putative metallocarboxypeptidase ecm14 [Kalmusia sp. IMI 367209]
MRQPPFTVLGLLVLSPWLVAAAPHESIRTDASTGSHTPPPWRKLSDAIVGRIWGSPDTQKSLGLDAVSSRRTPGRDLVARYGDDIVLRFTVTTAEEASALADAADILFLDVWEFNADWVDIRIAKGVVPSLLGLLPLSLQDAHVPLMQDLDLAQAIFSSLPSPSGTQSHDDDHSYSPHIKPSPQSGSRHPFFQDYQPLSVITPWMSLMASMFTTHVRRINIGVSYEGRDIPALRVGVHPTNNEQALVPRRTVLIVGGSHAREWISTSTVNYLAWTLINSYGKDREITRLLEQFDFVFVPTLNPDGYVYSWETDRLWRKNRQPTSLRFCRGVDLDRSYPFQWDGDSKPTNPCSESFPGDTPFHGVEAQRFADWAKNETENNVEFVGFLDLHSYSQQILYPYSYTCDEKPPTIENLEELALGLAKAIRTARKGHSYKVTSACEGNVALSSDPSDKKNRVVFPRIESSGGSALDWFYHELKVKYSFQIKLRDTGSYGFLLPKDNIVPTGNEILDAVLYLGRFMLGEVGILDAAPSAAEEVIMHGNEDAYKGEDESEEGQVEL